MDGGFWGRARIGCVFDWAEGLGKMGIFMDFGSVWGVAVRSVWPCTDGKDDDYPQHQYEVL